MWFDDEDDDDMPLSSLKKKGSSASTARESPKRKRKEVNYAVDNDEEEEDDDFDEDDDIPLAALKKSPSKSKPKPKAKASSSSSSPSKKKAKASSSSSSSNKKKAKSTPKVTSKPAPAVVAKSSEYLSPSAALYDSGCKKGMLIQKLLCRWWYAVQWPDPSTLPEKPPKHYDKLDGFEGVFVCTSGGKVGHIKDMRDRANCPSFANYARKPSNELKEMLLKALEEQKRQLIATEGSGTPIERGIEDDIKWVTKKVKPEEADKEAAKVLKAAKMTLS